MKVLLCENNLVGFLSAFYETYYSHKNADIISNVETERNLLDEYIYIEENIENAKKVRKSITEKGGKTFYEYISLAYCSNNKNKETVLFRYLTLFFKFEKKLFEMFDNEIVIAYNDILKKVTHEVHRLSAFIRLQEMANGIYYGYYSSDNDIIEKLMPNYIPQFNSQKFILHDYKRKKIAYFDGEKTHYSLSPDSIEIELSEAEITFQKLWKTYHKTVTIKDRENLKLQRQFLPKKYRHFMNEF